MKIVIHPGLHKTGTTFLQKEIFEKSNEVNYIQKLDILNLNLLPDKVNVISQEDLSVSIPSHINYIKTNRYQIVDFVKRLFPEAKVLITLRNFDDWKRSIYNQYIREGGILKWDEYWKKYSDCIIDMTKYTNYWKKHFDKVFIVYQEDLLYNAHTTIQKICNFIEIKVPNYNLIKYNTSLKHTNFHRLVNKLFTHPDGKGLLPLSKVQFKEVKEHVKNILQKS